MKKVFYSLFAMIAIAAVMFSCSEDPLPPVVQMFGEADADNPYTFNFTTTSENVSSYAWDFGDSETSTEANPSHTYAMSGDYSVKVTVTGEGGTDVAGKNITIAASKEEMLSGGPSATDGKTWVLSRTATTGKDGAANIRSDFELDILPVPDNMLDIAALGEEYDNEYTFYNDGTYKIKNVNGKSLAGWIFSAMEIGMDNVVITTEYGIFQVIRSNPTNATWSLTHETDLVIDAVNESFDPVKEETITFAAADYITFTNGGFIGIEDYYANSIIRDITPDRMVVTIFLHSVEAVATKPSIQFTLSYDKK